jgi:hypothetical protein
MTMPTGIEQPTNDGSHDYESPHRSVSIVSCSDGRCRGVAAAPPTDSFDAASLRHGTARGLLWIGGGFLFCPCHLPFTLWALATLFAGTAAEAVLHDHVVAASIVISAIWAAATWRGVRLLR